MFPMQIIAMHQYWSLFGRQNGNAICKEAAARDHISWIQHGAGAQLGAICIATASSCLAQLKLDWFDIVALPCLQIRHYCQPVNQLTCELKPLPEKRLLCIATTSSCSAGLGWFDIITWLTCELPNPLKRVVCYALHQQDLFHIFASLIWLGCIFEIIPSLTWFACGLEIEGYPLGYPKRTLKEASYVPFIPFQCFMLRIPCQRYSRLQEWSFDFQKK